MTRALKTSEEQIFVCLACSTVVLERRSGSRHAISSVDLQYEGRSAAENPTEFLRDLLRGLLPDGDAAVSLLRDKLGEPRHAALGVGLVQTIGFYYGELQIGNMTAPVFLDTITRLIAEALDA